MKHTVIVYLVLSGVIFCLLGCTKETKEDNDEVEVEIEVDSFKYLTPCLIDIVTDYSSYVLNDTIPMNDDYELEQIISMQVDSVTYYWLKTDKEDETEYVLTGECELFCAYGGWTGFEDACLSEFKERIWTLTWER